MDIIIPLNESRPMELPVYAEYFVNDEDYFYLFYFHISLSIMINITTLVATDTQLMVFCCHVSGVFAVIGWESNLWLIFFLLLWVLLLKQDTFIYCSSRLENFLEKDMSLHGLTDLQRKECYKHVSLSIKGHKRALELVL